MSNLDFPKAIADERGCGEREPGGIYVESGLSPVGLPIEYFLLDPPLAVPEELDLVNKPQVWLRMDERTQEPLLDPETGRPIYDLLIHVGAEHYPFAPDYIEETRRLGASRKLNPNLDLSRLTQHSRLLLAHPKAIPLNWHDLLPPQVCRKHLPGHALTDDTHRQGSRQASEQRVGPCLFKLWELLPQEAALATYDEQEEGRSPLCLRHIGSTLYEYHPTGEVVSRWQTGFILALPITGFALIQYADGTVNEKAKHNVVQACETNGASALPFYETPR